MTLDITNVKGALAAPFTKISNIKKLFYSKYMYKITFNCSLIRAIDISKPSTKHLIGAYLQSRINGTFANFTKMAPSMASVPRGAIKDDDVVIVATIIALMDKHKITDIRTRTEFGKCSIFVNNEDFINDLQSKIGAGVVAVYKPKDDITISTLTTGAETEISGNGEFQYKAYLKQLRTDEWAELKEFINDMPQLTKNIPSLSKKRLAPPYILIKSEKSAILFELRFNNVIRKLVKLVPKKELYTDAK